MNITKIEDNGSSRSTLSQSNVALLTAGRSQKERMVDREKPELHYFPQDRLTSSLEYIQYDASRGGSGAGL